MSVQKSGFQHREDRAILENEERSIRIWYVSTYNVFAENILRKHVPPTEFKIRFRISFQYHFVIKGGLFELHLKWVFKKSGFQHREDGTILENEERSVRIWYVSTGVFGSVSYSMSNKRSVPLRDQSRTFW